MEFEVIEVVEVQKSGPADSTYTGDHGPCDGGGGGTDGCSGGGGCGCSSAP